MPRKTKHNDITSPELLKQVNPENLQLLDDFMDYLKSVQRSETTREAYRNDIEIAFVWNLLHNNNIFFCDWTKRNIVRYQNWLINENGNSPARVRRLKAALSSLSNFIEAVLDTEYPNFRNIINKIESPINQPVREKTVLSDEEVQEILQMLVEKKKYEMACFVALAAYGGRRKSEICRFKVSDFTDDKLVCGGSLWRSSPMRTKGRGVQGKILQVYTLVKPFKQYLDLWINERKDRGIQSQWLFPDDLNPSEMMPISTVNSWMNTLSRLTGKDIYCHMFRHRYTTYLSDNGIPDAVIKEIQGWSDLTMVGVYVDRSTEDTLDMYFNEDGFKSVEARGLSEL